MISLSASESGATPEATGGTDRAFVGGAFSVRSRRSGPAVVAPTLTFRDNTGRDDLAVSVQNLSVTYRTRFERVPTFKKAITRRQRAIMEIQALREVTFDVPTGTAMGIIGSNGAGKSTLLRTLAGILSPSQGRVEVWGRASTLLAPARIPFTMLFAALGLSAGSYTSPHLQDVRERIRSLRAIVDALDVPVVTCTTTCVQSLQTSLTKVVLSPTVSTTTKTQTIGIFVVRVTGKRTNGSLSGPVELMFAGVLGVDEFQPESDGTICGHG